jgi:alkanesulfonate monooxygenase SsuD/methylene tetrahydromethanopterin reductase-like flavin-dependent oxidoreductase (luciferase family)
MEREHRAYGFPFPDTPARVAMFAEQLEIVHRLWTEERVTFRGAHYTLEDAPAQPKPVAKPWIVVGGGGKRGTVQPALKFADEYNTPFVSPAEFARIKDRIPGLPVSTMTGLVVGTTRDDALDRARTLYGRVQRDMDFDTWLARYAERAIVGSVDEVAARLREYDDAGCERVMLQHLLHTDLEPVRLVGELADAFRTSGGRTARR